MNEQTEIQKAEPAAIQPIDPASPAGLMSQLMGNGGPFDVEGFGKMLEYQERFEANQARKQYASDFATAQSNIAAVVKTKYNKQTKSNYPDLESVLGISKPVYTKQGFSIIYYEGKAEVMEDMRLCADVLHRSGHKETYHLDVPLDGKGIKGNANMTKIHGKASSITYGRRYLLCMIWNIPTQDEDGNAPADKSPKVTPPTEEEQAVLEAICKAVVTSDGMRVDVKKVTAIIYERAGKYPPASAVSATAKWITDMNKPEIFIPENRSEFEIRNDFPGDEDSRPDEPEQKEARYTCRNCDNEFDKLKNGKCPHCPQGDVLDRQAT